MPPVRRGTRPPGRELTFVQPDRLVSRSSHAAAVAGGLWVSSRRSTFAPASHQRQVLPRALALPTGGRDLLRGARRRDRAQAERPTSATPTAVERPNGSGADTTPPFAWNTPVALNEAVNGCAGSPMNLTSVMLNLSGWSNSPVHAYDPGR